MMHKLKKSFAYKITQLQCIQCCVLSPNYNTFNVHIDKIQIVIMTSRIVFRFSNVVSSTLLAQKLYLTQQCNWLCNPYAIKIL